MYDVLCMLPWFCAGSFAVLIPGLFIWIPLHRDLEKIRVAVECSEVCIENNRLWLAELDQSVQDLREDVEFDA